MQVFENSVWSFSEDRPVSAFHCGSVVVLDCEPSAGEIATLLEVHDRVVTPNAVHDIDGAYDRQSGESLFAF